MERHWISASGVDHLIIDEKNCSTCGRGNHSDEPSHTVTMRLTEDEAQTVAALREGICRVVMVPAGYASCGHKKYYDTDNCAVMDCSNYRGRHWGIGREPAGVLHFHNDRRGVHIQHRHNLGRDELDENGRPTRILHNHDFTARERT